MYDDQYDDGGQITYISMSLYTDDGRTLMVVRWRWKRLTDDDRQRTAKLNMSHMTLNPMPSEEARGEVAPKC